MNGLLVTGGVVFITAMIAAAASVAPIIRFARRTGYLDIPEGRKDHPHPMPYGGGFVILVGVAIPMLVGLGIASLPNLFERLPADVLPLIDGVRRRGAQVVAVVAGAVLLMVLGYIDDRRKLPVWPRLLAQGLAAAILVASGLHVTAWIPWPWLQTVVTMGFVILVVNAHNFVDNANGALGGVAAIEASGILVFAIAQGQWFVAALAACLVAALIVFLPANYPKPRLFMGDAGSFLVGFLLAGLVMMLRYDDGSAPWRTFLLPSLLLLVPVIDGVLVTVARIARGVSPFTAGHDHLLHRMAAAVGSRDKAVHGLWTLAWIGVLAANALSGSPRSAADLAFLPVLVTILWIRRRGVAPA